MDMGFNDEFDYLDDDFESDFDDVDDSVNAPVIAIKGSKKEEEKKASDENLIKEEPKKVKEKEYPSLIFVVQVTTNKEDKAMEMIVDKVIKKKIDVYAIVRPHGLRGFVFLESPDKENAEEAVYNLPYVKGILPTQVTYEEISQMLEPVASEIKIEKGDVVEIIGEAFKNEKAKVVRVDKTKGEAVISLLGAAVPIPVTVKLDNVKVIRREGSEE